MPMPRTNLTGDQKERINFLTYMNEKLRQDSGCILYNAERDTLSISSNAANAYKRSLKHNPATEEHPHGLPATEEAVLAYNQKQARLSAQALSRNENASPNSLAPLTPRKGKASPLHVVSGAIRTPAIYTAFGKLFSRPSSPPIEGGTSASELTPTKRSPFSQMASLLCSVSKTVSKIHRKQDDEHQETLAAREKEQEAREKAQADREKAQADREKAQAGLDALMATTARLDAERKVVGAARLAKAQARRAAAKAEDEAMLQKAEDDLATTLAALEKEEDDEAKAKAQEQERKDQQALEEQVRKRQLDEQGQTLKQLAKDVEEVKTGVGTFKEIEKEVDTIGKKLDVVSEDVQTVKAGVSEVKAIAVVVEKKIDVVYTQVGILAQLASGEAIDGPVVQQFLGVGFDDEDTAEPTFMEDAEKILQQDVAMLESVTCESAPAPSPVLDLAPAPPHDTTKPAARGRGEGGGGEGAQASGQAGGAAAQVCARHAPQGRAQSARHAPEDHGEQGGRVQDAPARPQQAARQQLLAFCAKAHTEGTLVEVLKEIVPSHLLQLFQGGLEGGLVPSVLVLGTISFISLLLQKYPEAVEPVAHLLLPALAKAAGLLCYGTRIADAIGKLALDCAANAPTPAALTAVLEALDSYNEKSKVCAAEVLGKLVRMGKLPGFGAVIAGGLESLLGDRSSMVRDAALVSVGDLATSHSELAKQLVGRLTAEGSNTVLAERAKKVVMDSMQYYTALPVSALGSPYRR